MFATLAEIFKDNWQWRHQTWIIGYYNLKKRNAGTALGWIWLFIKPTIYVVCFWFALEIGLRSGRSIDGEGPFILWLLAGMWNWTFMSGVLSTGSNIFNNYKYLVSKIKFPLSCIPTIFMNGQLISQLMLIGVELIIYFILGKPLTIYLLQLPIILALMYAFWYMISLGLSLVSALSKDFAKLVNAMSAPFFWTSGVIFSVSSINSQLIQTLFYFNPIYVIITWFRDALYYRCWIWDDPMTLVGYAVVFVITMLVMVMLYKRLGKRIQDGL